MAEKCKPLPGAANAGLTPSGFGWKYLHESPYLQVPCNMNELTSKFRVASTQREMAHRADKVVTDALGEGAVRQEEGGNAAMLLCRRKKQRSQPERPERTRARWQIRCSTKRANHRAEEATSGTGRGRRGRGGLPADLGGGWSRTRGHGRAGAGRPGGGASGRRGCPGTACRSSRSSTSPRASGWVLRVGSSALC